LADQQIKADNGWLYILNKPIEPPGPADVAIRAIGVMSGRGTTKFLALLQTLGMTAAVNSYKDVTM